MGNFGGGSAALPMTRRCWVENVSSIHTLNVVLWVEAIATGLLILMQALAPRWLQMA